MTCSFVAPTLTTSIRLGAMRGRYLPLTPVASAHCTIPTWTAAGDFEIEVVFATTGVGDLCFLSDGDAGDANYLRIDMTNSSLDAKINGLFTSNDGSFISDNKVNIATYSRIGTTLTVSLNGSILATPTISGAAIELGMLGARGGVYKNYFNGQILSVSLTDTAGGDNRVYGLDSGSIVYELPEGEVIGEELVTNGTFDSDSDWTKGTGWSIAGGAAVSAGSNGYDGIRQSPTLSVGSYYLITVDITEYTSGSIRPAIGATASGVSLSAVGSYSAIIKYTAPHTNGGTVIVFPWGDFVGSIDNVTAKELPNALIYNNFNIDDINSYGITPDSRLYKLNSGSTLYELPAGEVIGAELVTNGDMSSGLTGYTSVGTNTFDVVAGALHVGGCGGGDYVVVSASLIPGKTYKWSYDRKVVAINVSTPQGRVRVLYTDATYEYLPTAIINSGQTSFETLDGVITIPAAKTIDSIQLLSNSSSGDNDTIVAYDNISLKELPADALIYNNVNASNWEQYTYTTNIQHDAGSVGKAWLGQEKLNVVPWAAPPAGITVDDPTNTATFDGTQADWSSVKARTDLVAGSKYLKDWGVVDYTAGIVQVLPSAYGQEASAIGRYKQVASQGGANLSVQTWTSPHKFIGSVTLYSFKPLLEITT